VREIIFFSNNENKILEISNLFLNSSIKILNLQAFRKVLSPVETGETFEENAEIKSKYGLKKFKKICFADDSGICIKALGGDPGVNSKQFLYSEKNPINTLNKIIKITKSKKIFDAFFQTTICLSITKDKKIFFTGKINGRISNIKKGFDGFGYDPIFIPNGYNKTFAEMKLAEKNLISHRSIAIKKLRDYLIKLI